MFRLIIGSLVLYLVIAMDNPEYALGDVIEYQLDNNFVADGIENSAGFLFTGPADRFYFDFASSQIILSFDDEGSDVDLATVQIQGSAFGHSNVNLGSPTLDSFYEESGFYEFDFSFEVQRQSDLVFVNSARTPDIGTITNPSGEQQLFTAELNAFVDNLSFVLTFGDDLTSISGSGWIIGGGLAGDFHFRGTETTTETEVPEPISLVLLSGGALAALVKKRKYKY